MGSNDAPSDLKLPFIDFSAADHHAELKPAGTPYWDSLKFQVREALREYGCFEASFDKVPSQLRSDGFGSLKELFDLSLSQKQSMVGETAYQGYLGQQADYPLYESIGIHDPNLVDKVDTFTNTLWPKGNPSFSKNIQSLSEKVAELDRIARRMIVESFGLEKYMDEHMSSTKYNLRLTKYESPGGIPDPKLGLKPHTDKNMITILWQNQVDGLEIQTKKGEWIKFQPSTPDSFVVLIGDSLYVWLNGRVHCPYHRVMISGNEPRYSFGLFSSPKAGYIIEAPQELIDQHHPLMFKPFEYKQYLALTFSQAGQREADPLRAYFGI